MDTAETAGLRQRKRQDTMDRITRAGLKLFGSSSYEATTIDDIAAEAGISRRTFFHYFKSKDDILVSLQSGLGRQLAAAIADKATGLRPLDAVRAATLSLVSAHPRDELVHLDRLMRASETVQARKRANYIIEEWELFDALRDLWPGETETRLRALAMLAIGGARLSLDAWTRADHAGRAEDYINGMFDAIEAVAAPD